MGAPTTTIQAAPRNIAAAAAACSRSWGCTHAVCMPAQQQTHTNRSHLLSDADGSHQPPAAGTPLLPDAGGGLRDAGLLLTLGLDGGGRDTGDDDGVPPASDAACKQGWWSDGGGGDALHEPDTENALLATTSAP